MFFDTLAVFYKFYKIVFSDSGTSIKWMSSIKLMKPTNLYQYANMYFGWFGSSLSIYSIIHNFVASLGIQNTMCIRFPTIFLYVNVSGLIKMLSIYYYLLKVLLKYAIYLLYFVKMLFTRIFIYFILHWFWFY